MVVNHNIPALSTYNVINNTSSALQKSINKLSTGLRINSAADDAAGLAISEKMRAQVRGLDQAVSNSQDGISMIQTAEGALSETHSILQRMRELSVQAANDTLTQQDRGYIQDEVDQLREEITRIGNTTQFNKKKLLNGDAAVLWSSSDNSTKAIIKGGLRTIDQFGQKSAVEGNYNIKIKAEAGQGEVQKSDIMKIKHPNVVMNKNLESKYASDVRVDNVPAAEYTLKASGAFSGSFATTGHFGIGAEKNETKTTFSFASLAGNGDYETVNIKMGNKVIWQGSIKNDLSAAGVSDFFTDNKDEIVKAAKDDGVTLGMSGAVWTATTYDGSKGPEFTIDFEDQVDPSKTSVSVATAATSSFGQVISVSSATTGLGYNASVLFEVTGVDTSNDTITVKATANILKNDGTTETKSLKELTLTGNSAADLSDLFGVSGATVTLQTGMAPYAQVGGKWVTNFASDTSQESTASDVGIKLTGTMDSTWDDGKWNKGPFDGETVKYNLKADKVAGEDVHFKNFYLNGENGEVTEGDIILSLKDGFKNVAADVTAAGGDVFVGSFDAAYIGKVASGDVKLRDLDKFWDSEGNFMLTDPQTITITQGDGKSAEVTLYANDTLNDVANKFNNAISEGLGQGKYTDDASNFATFTSTPTNGDTSQSVRGTFLLRSVVPGSNGTLSLSGSENIINAFSLNTIQEAKETSFTADITDAHTGSKIASDVKVTGNKLIGVIHENVDVEFDNMAGLSASWDSANKKYTYKTQEYNTTLHLSDNTTVFQIGANEGEDMGINIGDMRSHALGLDEVNVTNRERAARSITVIDNAIDKVSTQRSKLGAYQNRLEHTINNLTTASENLTAAESRIRDTDMAKEMMNFSKLQIMLQAGNSMLAQANQLPQNVLSLVR
ncbi:MAG: flagellin [Fretibacterium sp.]|nr:flagellin [Fretibacterium sp.]